MIIDAGRRRGAADEVPGVKAEEREDSMIRDGMANEEEDEDGGLGGNQKRRGVVVWLFDFRSSTLSTTTPSSPGPLGGGSLSLSGFFRFRFRFPAGFPNPE